MRRGNQRAAKVLNVKYIRFTPHPHFATAPKNDSIWEREWSFFLFLLGVGTGVGEGGREEVSMGRTIHKLDPWQTYKWSWRSWHLWGKGTENLLSSVFFQAKSKNCCFLCFEHRCNVVMLYRWWWSWSWVSQQGSFSAHLQHKGGTSKKPKKKRMRYQSQFQECQSGWCIRRWPKRLGEMGKITNITI